MTRLFIMSVVWHLLAIAIMPLSILAAEHHSTAEQCTRLLYDWFNADNDTMESLLVTFDWQLILYNNPCAMDFYCTFLQILRDIISQCVPVKKRILHKTNG